MIKMLFDAFMYVLIGIVLIMIYAGTILLLVKLRDKIKNRKR